MALGEQFVMHHASRVPPAAKENFPSVGLRLGLGWRVFFSWQPVGHSLFVFVKYPALVPGDETFKKLLPWLEKQ